MASLIGRFVLNAFSAKLILPSTVGAFIAMNTPTSAATFSADFSFTGVTGVIFFDPVPGAISDEVFATHTSTSVLVTSLQHGLDNAVFSPRGTADLRVVDGIVVNADLGSQYVDGPELYGLESVRSFVYD